MGVKVTAHRQMHAFFDDVFTVHEQNQCCGNGNNHRARRVALKINVGQRQASHAEQAGQNGLSKNHESAQKNHDENQRLMIVVNRQGAEQRGDAFAAAKPQLYGPDVAGGDSQHGQRGQLLIGREMARHPNRQRAFANITKGGEDETALAKIASDIFRADAAAANLADVLTGPPANKIIANGETTEQIGAKTHTQALMPVDGLQLLNPRHIRCVFTRWSPHSNPA